MIAGRFALLLALAVSQITFTSPTRIKRAVGDLILIELENKVNLIYYGRITVGTSIPAREIPVIFSTGTSEVVVPAPAKDPHEELLEKQGFDSTQRSSYSVSQDNLSSLTYNDYNFAGVQTSDTIKIGSGNVTLKWEQEFLLATTITTSKEISGMFGLSLKSTSEQNSKTPVDAMFAAVTQNGLNINQQFAFYFRPKKTLTSKLVIGGFDEEFIEGNFTKVDVLNNGTLGWVFQIDRFSVQGVEVMESCLAQPTSGSSTIALASTAYTAVNMALFGKTYPDFNQGDELLFPCGTGRDRVANKILEFTIADKIFTLSPEEYIVETHENYSSSSDRSKCIYGISESETGHIELGLPFMRKYYTRFDYMDKKIEFGLTKDFLQQ